MATPTMLAAVNAAFAAGLCILPPREDGSKAPDCSDWKRWQRERPNVDQVRAYYSNGRTGLGLVTGAVSGNLEVLDFDAGGECFEALKARAHETGLGEVVDRLDAGYCEQGPGGGFHWLYRCDEIASNTKLARRPKLPSEQKDEHDRTQVLIETRGEGGFIVVAPSHGKVHPSRKPYVLLRGGLSAIPRITPEEREALFALARTFDAMPVRAHEAPRGEAQAAPLAAGERRPGDDFVARTTWAEVLEPAGWTFVRAIGAESQWCRPGKKGGISATTNHGGHDYFVCFSTSVEGFETERGYNRFSAWAILNHGGDFAAAAKALAAQGYGSPPKAQTKAPAPEAPQRDPKKDPHDLDSERAVLGALLASVDAIDRVADQLSVRDFYKTAHAQIFQAIVDLHNVRAPVDQHTVCSELRRTGLLAAVGGPEAIAALPAAAPDAKNAPYYAKQVIEKAQELRLKTTLTEALRHVAESRDQTAKKLEHVEQAVFEVCRARGSAVEPLSMGELLAETLKSIELIRSGAALGVHTGWAGIDEVTNGLRPGDLSVIAARPAMGKSAWALNLCRNISLSQGGRPAKHCVLVSLEMSTHEIGLNFLCMLAGVDSHKVRGNRLEPNEHQELLASADEMREALLDIRGCEHTVGYTVAKVRSLARRFQSEGRLDVLVVDYLQLLSGTAHSRGRSRENEVAEISRDLRFLAAELKIPIVALAQLNRGVEMRAEKRPRISDLRESGGCEQDASLILLLHRESYYDKDATDAPEAEIIVGKNRYGPAGMTVPFLYDRRTGRFRDADAPVVEQPRRAPPNAKWGSDHWEAGRE